MGRSPLIGAVGTKTTFRWGLFVATAVSVLSLLPSAKGERFERRQTFNDPTVTNEDNFGDGVALDGDRVLVGAPQDDTKGTNVGQAHLFNATTGSLLRTFNDPTPGSGDRFGVSVAIDGDNVVIGDYRGSAH